MFRNLRFYRLDCTWPADEATASEALTAAAFTPCGPLTERSSGFVPIDTDAGDSLVRRVNGAELIRLRTQSRVLPAAAVNEALEARIEEFTARTGEAPTAREKRRLKAETKDELLTKAMLRSQRVWAFVDPERQLLAVDSAQTTVAERIIRRLKAALGDFDCVPLAFERPVAELLTRVFLGDGPERFALGRECKMQDAKDAGSTVRWNDFDLGEPSIRRHVAEGMRLTQLAIVHDNVLSAVLDENGVLRKIKVLGMDDDAEGLDDPLARLDAEFALTTGLVRQLLDDLAAALGTASPQDRAA